MSNKYNDVSLDELEARMLDAIDKGFKCYQKFTCAHCGSRQTMGVYNTIFLSGTCEACGKVTQITEGGFLVIGKFLFK